MNFYKIIFLFFPLCSIPSFKNFILLVFVFLLSSCVFLQPPSRLIFQWPLKKYKITQKFYGFKSPPHLGIDLKAPIGTAILSSHSGRVVYAGKRLTGYGNMIVLEHPLGWTSLYAHLHTIKVKIGQRVKQGDVIGTLGMTGRASGPHLHFELMYKGEIVNPMVYLP